jgi:hypothetical protein
MLCYVNIALGFIFWRVFLHGVLAQLFVTLRRYNVLQAGRAKSMTKNKTEGHGCGEGQKRQGVF